MNAILLVVNQSAQEGLHRYCAPPLPLILGQDLDVEMRQPILPEIRDQSIEQLCRPPRRHV